MKKKNFARMIAAVAATSTMIMQQGMVSYAMVKHIDLEVDKESIPSDISGVAFMPEFVISDDVDGEYTIDIVQGVEASDNPTIPKYYEISIHAEDEILDDDLDLRAKGARTASIEYVSEDNSEAKGLLQVYPFYKLMAPAPIVDVIAGTASWDGVPYAGKYEYVVTYVNKNGKDVSRHGKTSELHIDISKEINMDQVHEVGVAVRALSTKSLDYEEVKKLLPDIAKKSSEYKYYNIASSDFGYAGARSVDTTDYENDDPWDFAGTYTSVADSAVSATIKKSAVSGADGIIPEYGSAAGDPNWKRVTYRWQYLVNGVPFNGGWKNINNVWYYFDPDGYMHTGWLTDVNGKRYYLESKIGDTNGMMVTGIRDINGKTYVFGSDGVCQN